MTVYTAMLHGPGDLRLDRHEIDPAAIAPTQVLVVTEATGFSTGTDLGNYEGRSQEVPGAPPYPRAVGYSNVGVIRAVGRNVTRFKAGDLVFGMKPHCSAWLCDESDLLIRVPDGIDAGQASLGYLVNLGVASLRQVHYETGETVAVVGLGVIGLSTIAVAHAMGARVAGVANDDSRKSLAERLGAEASYRSGEFDEASVFEGCGADIVVLTANTWEAWRSSMELVRYGGRVSVLGFPGRAQAAPDFNPLDAKWLYGKQITICGAGHMPRIECGPGDLRFNLRRNLEYVFQLMASHRLEMGPIISHRLPYDRMKEAYELARAHSKRLTAAVFDWRGSIPH